jgi:DNA-binding cell septation regulator SpoVG
MKITNVKFEIMYKTDVVGKADIEIDKCMLLHNVYLIKQNGNLNIRFPNIKTKEGWDHPIKFFPCPESQEFYSELKQAIIDAYNKIRGL